MTIFRSLYTGNHLLLPTLWWLYPTPTTPPPIGNFHTPSYTLPSYSKPKYSLPNMFLPTTSTTTTTSTKNQGYQNHKNNPASPKTFTSNTTFSSSTATYTTMSTTNQGSFPTIINNNHHNYSTTTTSLLPLHHTPTTLQTKFLEFPGEALLYGRNLDKSYRFIPYNNILIHWDSWGKTPDNLLRQDIFNWEIQ